MIRASLAGLLLGLVAWAIALEVRRNRRAKRIERLPLFDPGCPSRPCPDHPELAMFHPRSEDDEIQRVRRFCMRDPCPEHPRRDPTAQAGA